MIYIISIAFIIIIIFSIVSVCVLANERQIF